jgi:phenylpyruvate tautomerase PptA (4-oxalocrotonate tautomerase family)
MPIADVVIVSEPSAAVAQDTAARLAHALGSTFGAAPGRVWVRLKVLPSHQYAENDAVLTTEELPVFVTLVHAVPPEGEARQREVLAITKAIAECLGRPAERVHLEYAAAGRGRIAFGGRLVT